MQEAPLLNDGHDTQRTRRLLSLMKVLFFLGGFSGSAFGRFATLFYLSKPRQFSAALIGIIEAAQPPANALGNTVLGYVSDRLQHKKAVSLACRVITTLCISTFLVPQVGCCFTPILIMMICTAAFSVGGGILDAYTLDLLGPARKGEYGRYRLWTAVAWGVGNVGMGVVAQYNFDINLIAFAVLNAVSIVLMAVALPMRTSGELSALLTRRRAATASALTNAEAVAVPAQSPPARTEGSPAAAGFGDATRSCHRGAEYERDHPSHSGAASGGGSGSGSGGGSRGGSGGGTFCGLLCSTRFALFLIEAAFIGFALTLVEKFLFVYLINELGATATLCGLTVGVTVVFELPIFQYGDVILRTVGHDLMLIVAIVAYAVRCYGYTLLEPHTVWWVLLLEVLHGVTFGLAWTAAVDKVKAEVPSGWHTSGQLAMNTAMNSFGSTAGALIGGYTYSHVAILGSTQGKALYTAAAIAAACAVTLHASASLILKALGYRALMTPPEHEKSPSVEPLQTVPTEAPLAAERAQGSSGRSE